MSSRDLEKEYDPTQWSQRITDSKKLLQSHVEFGNTGGYYIIVIIEFTFLCKLCEINFFFLFSFRFKSFFHQLLAKHFVLGYFSFKARHLWR